jgi:hypothetical protein
MKKNIDEFFPSSVEKASINLFIASSETPN